MKITLGCDHAAFHSKEKLKKHLMSFGFEINDIGAYGDQKCDYPDLAMEVVRKVITENTLGILLCGSGIGMSMVANRFKGIRAALCRTADDARLSREHNDANILCLGGRINSDEEIIKMVEIWLGSNFEGGRHNERISKFNQLGEEL